MAQKTISQLIDELTWFDLVNKLKKILKGFVGSIGGNSTFIEEGDNVSIEGTGTEDDPYIISADGGGGIEEAPLDGGPYGRQAANWVEIETGSSTGLEAIDEGNGIGWRLIGRNPANYGNIGLDAVDLSTGVSSSDGATGLRSFAMGHVVKATGRESFVEGSANMASGDYSHAEGATTVASGRAAHSEGGNTTASGAQSHAEGSYTTASGQNTHSGGFNTSALSFSETAIGTWGTSYSPSSTSAIVATDRLFGVYNGTATGARSNAFIILKNGTITAPSLTTSLIDTAGAKALVTKEYNDKQTLTSYTVATLPASPTTGDQAAVTDALTPTYLGIVAGGGTTYCPVVYNGTNWVCH